jgi:hypothetical protein
VLASRRPPVTPDRVVTDGDPARLLGRLRAGNRGGDVHLVGGPRTIEAFRALGALDALELVVLPPLLGDGMRLTPSIAADAGLTFVRERALPGRGGDRRRDRRRRERRAGARRGLVAGVAASGPARAVGSRQWGSSAANACGCASSATATSTPSPRWSATASR